MRSILEKSALPCHATKELSSLPRNAGSEMKHVPNHYHLVLFLLHERKKKNVYIHVCTNSVIIKLTGEKPNASNLLNFSFTYQAKK